MAPSYRESAQSVINPLPKNRSSRWLQWLQATENLWEEKKGKVREQVDLFVVAQRAQPVLCYHKKVGQNENLFLKIGLVSREPDTRMSRGEGEGGCKAGQA